MLQFAGTFAVVSLMIGVVVDKADCSPPNSISLNTTADPNGTMDCVQSNCRSLGFLQNSTVANATDFHSSGNYDVEMCKVGYAVAASMMVGVYQVITIEIVIVSVLMSILYACTGITRGDSKLYVRFKCS